jgi:hypothetical protein
MPCISGSLPIQWQNIKQVQEQQAQIEELKLLISK